MQKRTGLDPLFVGLTRPAMVWGVHFNGIILGVGLVGILMIATSNPLMLLLYIPMHGVLYGISLQDPYIFRLLYLWSITKLRSLGFRHWGAFTASPFIYKRWIGR